MIKNILITGLIILIFSGSGFAQSRTYFDFEEVIVEGFFTWSGATWEGIVENPSKTGVNVSDSVGLSTTGTAKFAGIAYVEENTIDLTESQLFTMDVYSAEAGFVKLKLEDKDDNSISIVREVEYSTPGEWQNLSFNFSDGLNHTYSKVTFIFDSKSTDAGKEWYLDNLKGPELTQGVVLSDDATLSALATGTGNLYPEFDPSVTSYTLTVPEGITTVDVTATAADDNASVSGDGSINVSSGSGTAEIVVTAEDAAATTMTYTVAIIVEGGPSDAKLSGLTVDAGTLFPEFDPSVTTYTLTVSEGTTTVEVTATPNGNASVSGDGLTELISGSGTATVIVTSEDGSAELTYTIDILVSGQVKYNPGNYATLQNNFTQAELQEALTTPGLKGVQLRYSWKGMETAEGVYDFSKIESDLEMVSAAGMHLIVFLEDKSFKNGVRYTPEYLWDEYTVPTNKSQNGEKGFISKRWDNYVVEKISDMMDAMAEKFDDEPGFEGVAFQETAIGLTDENIIEYGYTPEKYRDALIQMLINTKGSFKNSQVFWYMNFFSGHQSYIGDIATAIIPYDILMGGPDILPNNNSLKNLAYPFYEEFKDDLNLFCSMQFDSYHHPHSGGGYDTQFWTMEELYLWAKENLYIDYTFWNIPKHTFEEGSYSWDDAKAVISKYADTPATAEALFTVVATNTSSTDFKIELDNNAAPISLYDDGTNGDETASDGTWSILVSEIVVGDHLYDVMVDGVLIGNGNNIPFTISETGEPTVVASFNYDGSVVTEQTPYGGDPVSIPGQIEAENFDNGGENVAFSSQVNANVGSLDYRPEASSVGIEQQADGAATVVFTAEEEWLEYTVDVAAGIYDVKIAYATGVVDISDERGIKVLLDEEEILDFDTAAVGGDWANYLEHTIKNVTLPKSIGGVLKIIWKTGGFNLDYIKFESVELLTGVSDNLKGSAQFNCYPNPFRDKINFEFDLKKGSDVKLSIYNISGKRVFTMGKDSMAAGRQRLVWNEKSTDGKLIPNGTYFAKLNLNGKIVTRKIIKN